MRTRALIFAAVLALLGASARAQTGPVYEEARSASSGNVANAAAVCTLPAAVSPSNASWDVTGFEITGGGATAAAIVTATLTGLLGDTPTYNVAVPAGATAGLNLVYNFPGGLQGTPATAVVLTVPAFGAGNTNAACVLHGYLAP